MSIDAGRSRSVGVGCCSTAAADTDGLADAVVANCRADAASLNLLRRAVCSEDCASAALDVSLDGWRLDAVRCARLLPRAVSGDGSADQNRRH